MKIAAILLALIALTGCDVTDPHGLTREAEACYRQGYGGMVVQIQARKTASENFQEWTMTSSCMGTRSHSPENKPAPARPPQPQPKRFDT